MKLSEVLETVTYIAKALSGELDESEIVLLETTTPEGHRIQVLRVPPDEPSRSALADELEDIGDDCMHDSEEISEYIERRDAKLSDRKRSSLLEILEVLEHVAKRLQEAASDLRLAAHDELDVRIRDAHLDACGQLWQVTWDPEAVDPPEEAEE